MSMLPPFDGVGGGPLAWHFVLGLVVGWATLCHMTHVMESMFRNVVVANCLGNTHTGPSKAHKTRLVRGHAVRRGIWDAMCSLTFTPESVCHAEKMR